MAIDLTGGIDPAREYMFAERPNDPEMRDSVSFWVFDDRGQVGLPRVGVEAVADELGGAQRPGQRRVSGRPGVSTARRGQGVACRKGRTASPRCSAAARWPSPA